MTFTHHIQFETSLSAEQVENTILNNTLETPNKPKPLFKGDSSSKSFNLMPTFGKKWANFISPVVKGEIVQKDKTTIRLSFELPNYLKVIFHGILLINIIALITSIYNLTENFQNNLALLSYVFGILITILVFNTVYHSVLNKTLRILFKLFKK